jgi:hypothetical protein
MKTQNRYRQTAVILACFMLALLIASCQQTARKTSEKATEKALENATGGQAKVNLDNQSTEITTKEGTIKFDANIKSWPSDIPSVVPKFTAGRIEGATIQNMKESQGWSLVFKDLPDEAVVAYNKALEASGFETTVISAGQKVSSIMAEKGKIHVTFMGGEGSGNLSVAIDKTDGN